MELFLINITDPAQPCALVKDIQFALDGLAGIIIHTQLRINQPGRIRASDYDDGHIAFSGPTDDCFRLGNEAVYICRQYRALRYVHESSQFYAIFKATQDTGGAWNVVRQLLPAPEEVYNCPIRRVVECLGHDTFGTLYVDTSKKRALLDAEDVSNHHGAVSISRPQQTAGRKV